MLPEKIRLLNVSIGETETAGQLLRAGTYEFRYLHPDPDQAPVALLMPAA
jgi:serine/threonine-protein kinase HipA